MDYKGYSVEAINAGENAYTFAIYQNNKLQKEGVQTFPDEEDAKRAGMMWVDLQVSEN